MSGTSENPSVHLEAGKHGSPDEGVCIMELASMLGGESFSDYSRRICPVVGAFLRGYNDLLADELRQDLRPYAERVLDTRADAEVTDRRELMCLTWARQLHDTRRFRIPWGPPGSARWTVEDCVLAGEYAAKMASRDPAWHGRTLAFIDALLAVGESDRSRLASP